MVYDLNAMVEWENGELDDEGTRKLFQQLVDSGMAWTLQGSYGRMAQRLLDAGEIHHPYNFRVNDVMEDGGRESGFHAITRHGER
jgi:hypothetical protein